MMNRWASPQFPRATFTINVSGSFAMGFLAMALARGLLHPNVGLLPVLDEMVGGGLIVVENVHVVRYLHEPKPE